MPNYNKVTLIGHLGRDPEIKHISNDRQVAKWSLAVTERYTSGGEKKEDTTWIDCEAWGKTAEIAGQYLAKGRACLVEGRLKLDQWEDKDGNKRSKHKVVVDRLVLLGGKQDGEERPAQQSRPAPASSVDEEPPF